ncbi:MAG: LPS-assembly protein LptD [Puniceicoccales bacterium]|jgi:hypothetical protein|nr:LPS-assembly protein LptD [Puniceicoccales bacterium]
MDAETRLKLATNTDKSFLPSTPILLKNNVIPMAKRRILGIFGFHLFGLLLPTCLPAVSPISNDLSGNASEGATVRIVNNAYISATNLQYSPLRMEASNGICYSDDILMLTGEALRGDPGSNTFVVKDVRITNGFFCGRAKSALHTEKDGKRRTVLRHGEIYFGEPNSFAPGISFSRIVIDDMEHMRFRDATLKVGNHGVFYFPYYSTPIRQSPYEVHVSYGRREELGLFGKHQILLPAGKHIKYGFAADFYTRRGILVGPALDAEYPTGKVQLRSGFIHDKNVPPNDGRGNMLGKSRNFMSLCYRQNIRSNFHLCGEFNRTSDALMLQDFRRREFLRNQFPDNFFETSYTWQNNIASILVRVNANDTKRTVERLPQLRYERISTHFSRIPAYYNGFFELAHLKLRQDDLPSVVRAETYCGVDIPMKWQSFLTLNPLIGNRITVYHFVGGNVNYSQNRLQIGCDLRMNFSGDWDLSLPKWELYNIHHKITPIFQYRHTWQKKTECQVPFDVEIDSSAIPSINLAERWDTDDNLAIHVLRIGVENLFQSMKNKTDRHTFAELDFFEDLQFQNPKDGRRWSDLYTTLSLLPGDFLSMQICSQIDLARMIINDIQTFFSLRDAMLWRLSLTHNLFKDGINQYGLHFNRRLNCNNLIECFWRYDVRTHRLIQQRYGFRRRINHTWRWDTNFNIRSKKSHVCRWQISTGISLPS